MDEREQRIRERAHRLWEEEGRPDGRADDHWVQAREIVALEDSHADTLKPIGSADEPVEPIEALINMGEFPTLTDQGEMQIPHRPEEDLDTPATTAPAPAPASAAETASPPKAPARRRSSSPAS